MWRRAVSCVVAAFGMAGCSVVPPYDLASTGPASSPAGPKVAAIIANLKCELFEAANSNEEIPRYFNDPTLAVRYDPSVPGYRPSLGHDDLSRRFTLKHLFEEIEYVGEAQFQLDVTSSPGLNPSTSFINPTPALTLSVNGSFSEAAHRNLQIYSSVDFERLVQSEPYNFGVDREDPQATFVYDSKEPSAPCNGRTELGGSLGLKENLIYHAITGDMNDISVWPSPGSTTKISTSDFFTKYGVDVFTVQIDFTVTSGIAGGPNWALTHFTGPNSNAGLFNYSRNVKDTLTLTILPICIRQKYRPINKAAPFEYQPKLVEGTPRWANFLPQCSAAGSLKVQGLATARSLNILKTSNPNVLALPR